MRSQAGADLARPIANTPRATTAPSRKPPSDLTLIAHRHIRKGSQIGAGSVKPSAKYAILLAIVAFGAPGFSDAQQAPKSKAGPRAAQTTATPATPATPSAPAAAQADTPLANAPAPPGWAARCNSASRDAPLECAIEQTAVLSKTGQLIVLANIRVPSDTHAPVALVQLPLGLNRPAGPKLQFLDAKPIALHI